MFNRGEIMSEEERVNLYNWIESDIKNEFVFEPKFNKSIYSIPNINIHPLIKIIYDRLIEKETLEFYNNKTFLGDFISYIHKDGFIHPHKDDLISSSESIHVRFNIFIRVPPNDIGTYYGGFQVDTKEKCYVVSRSGVDMHHTDKNTTDIPRISISFGFLLPHEKVDELCKNNSYLESLSHIKIFNRGIIISEDERLQIKDFILSNNLNNEFIECMKARLIDKEGLDNSLNLEASSYIISYGEQIPKSKHSKIQFHIWIQVPKKSSYAYYSGLPINTTECSYSLWRGVDEFWTSPNQEFPLIILCFSTELSLKKIDELTSNFSIDMHINYPLCVE
jgi:hypothetical protein